MWTGGEQGKRANHRSRTDGEHGKSTYRRSRIGTFDP
jgi:hypothetical protein